MKILNTFFCCLLAAGLFSQTASIIGQLQDAQATPVIFANVALYADSTLVKIETTDESGVFRMNDLKAGTYRLVATYVGMNTWERAGLTLKEGQQLDLGKITLSPTAVELAEAVVTANRVMVEVKPDRTVFNVQGTINSAGQDAISLLRKAPGVTVDNQDNVNVLGRAGVMIYVDGKRLPLTGQDLTNYLQNLPAEQIDRFEIITNPGAKYEAEGNAGIIDIRLKKDKNLGANGTVSLTGSQGRRFRGNTNASGNYRNKQANIFGAVGTGDGRGLFNMDFLSYQNGLVLPEQNYHRNHWQWYDYRLGTDFFVSKNHTLGFLATGGASRRDQRSFNRIELAQQTAPSQIDSILIAHTTADYSRNQQTYNLNYRFDPGQGRSFNVDVDYGRYENRADRYQPNQYYDASEQVLLTEIINTFNTPTDIDIYTAKVDYEQPLFGGTLGLGSKVSKVASKNTFLVFDEINGQSIRDDSLSNRFDYDENVYAGYVNYARQLAKKWNLSAGLRVEQTDATGDLQAFLTELQEPPVEQNYLSWFPSGGLTYQLEEQHNLAFNYSRRINRPDYNVLNPFNNKISQLSYEKGNARLRPEIVNNLELGYTYAYRYNFKIARSRTTDQITRLIAPDTSDLRAGFITWDNLASQTIWSANLSAPVDISKKWNLYLNFSGSHQNNQADYGDSAIVDVQAWSYNIYLQNTITLPLGLKFEIGGWYNGPGIWGGVFVYDPSWSLDMGLQRKFLQESLNIRLNVNDIFYQSGWSGYSDFNGLYSIGSGRWDARQVNLSLSYNFGNQNVKSRNRQSGLEEEGKRTGGGGGG